MKIAVIGMGNMGTAHANCIANGEIEGMTLSAVCDLAENRVESFVEKFPKVLSYTDYSALLKDKVADAVLVAVPHRLHAEMATQAFNAGLHVLIEKPADISVSEVQAMNEVAEKSGKVFGIMFNQRTNPLFNKAREMVKSGQLGELIRTVWIVTNWYRSQDYYDSGDWRATWSGEGGGVLINQAPHNLDLWQWICGMPKSVTAFCNVGKYHKIEVEDDATIYTKYENGATGVFITSTGEYPGTNRLEISGTRGKIVLENGMLKWWRIKEDKSGEIEYTEIKQEEAETAHKGILKNFADAVLHNADLIAPGYDGINELTISNAAYLSDWSGNKEITIPFDTEAFDRKLKALADKSNYHQGEVSDITSAEYKQRWAVNW